MFPVLVLTVSYRTLQVELVVTGSLRTLGFQVDTVFPGWQHPYRVADRDYSHR